MKKLFLIAVLLLLPSLASAEIAEIAKAIPTLNMSVIIAAGNSFQTISAKAVGRRSLTIQNNNASDACWITFGSISGVTITAANASKATSIQLAAGQSYTRYYPYIPNDEIEGTCAATSDTLYVDTQ